MRVSEFVASACVDSIAHPLGGGDHSAHIPDHGNLRRDRPARCRGWPASGPGQAPAWPLVLTGVSAVVSRVKRDFACTLTARFRLCWLSCGHSRAWGWRGGHVHSAGDPRV